MDFVDELNTSKVILAEGAVIERLRRDRRVRLDPQVENAGLVFDPAGHAALESIYRSYLDVGRRYARAMVVLSPTWRASGERCAAAGLECAATNAAGVGLLKRLRMEYRTVGLARAAELAQAAELARAAELAGRRVGDTGTGEARGGPRVWSIWIGGLLGCRGDAYRPGEALSPESAERYHAPQVAALAAAGPDFLLASTLPALSEALGLAQAMSVAGLPYFLSFVLRPEGTLLDGTPLREALARIDAEVRPGPAGYWANCVHPGVFAEALERAGLAEAPARAGLADAAGPGWGAAGRLSGLQANTSRLSPEELDQRSELEAESPTELAAGMLAAHQRFGVRVLGGCCGTDERHIAAIAEALAGERRGA